MTSGRAEEMTEDEVVAKQAGVQLTHDRAINYAFQQNAIPVVKELRFQNDAIARKGLVIRVSTEPAFAPSVDVRLQSTEPNAEFRIGPLDLKLSHDFLAAIDEKVSGWLRVDVLEGENVVCTVTEPIALLARNEWCGLVSLPEILAAFVLPNDPAVVNILSRASELLRDHTGRGAFTGYQDKNRKRAWEQIAAIYKAVGELRIRYIVAPASFETTGQKVRLPSDILEQRFGNCLDLSLLFAACCEQAGLHSMVLVHEGHAYAGCWLEQRTMPEPSSDDLQHVRKLVADDLLVVFESTNVADESPGTLKDAELAARAHLHTSLPFRLALDIRRSRVARIHPLPIARQATISVSAVGGSDEAEIDAGLGDREVAEVIELAPNVGARAATRIDHWKSRLLDLSLRNRLLNFKETKSTIQILSAAPEKVEDELAAELELSLQPKPKVMGDRDPRDATTYTKQQRADALAVHLQDELDAGRLHTHLDEAEHPRRLTELYRATRTALEENGTNTLFAAVGILEWRETEHSDRVLRAPLLLVPVELKRKSVLEGFTLRRLDEEARLNVTLMEMLRQHFQKNIAGLDPLPEDENGVDVAKVLQVFREAVRHLAGWEIKAEVWLGQFSFTKFLLWKDLDSRLESLIRNPIVDHLVNRAGVPYPNPSDDIRPQQLDELFHPRQVFCPRSADSSQLAAVMAAAAGHDFVLEGPPGTGKSQTITNIISHCLAEGKRVLFVAEKRAALDVVHRRLRESGLGPFCLELHSNKVGKADVLAQFDRSLKSANVRGVLDWDHRAEELDRLRVALNEYTGALHRPHPCGLSAYDCLDYLLPRQGEPTVTLDGWSPIRETPRETVERARVLAGLLQDRSRGLMPLADHALAPLACTEWSPTWAEHALGQIREMAAVTESARDVVRDLNTWLHRSNGALSRWEFGRLLLLVESLLSPKPVGADFATTTWTQLSAQLDGWTALVRERHELRLALGLLHEPVRLGSVAVPCEAWSVPDAERAFEGARGLGWLATQAADATRDLRSWLRVSRPSDSRAQLAHFSAIVESLIATPADVGGALATAPWNTTARELDRLIALTRERSTLRERIVGYDERKLLALDLDEIDRIWRSASGSWFLVRWLRTSRVRRDLRPARVDGTRPDIADLSEVLTAALRLRAVNAEIAATGQVAEPLLGPTWCNGEPRPDELESVRSWGTVLHERIDAVAADDPAWMDQLRRLCAELFVQGRSSFAGVGAIGALLIRYRDAMATFDHAYDALATSAALRRAPLDGAPDHLSAVSAALERFMRSAPRVRTINADLAAAGPTAHACLGALWANGEPVADTISDARAWGEVLHARMLACAGDDLLWLGQLRQQLASLFTEGPSAYAPGTSIGDRFVGYRESHAKFQAALDSLTAQIQLRREMIDAASDHLGAVLELARRVADAWPKIREWCSWQKARHEGLTLALGPVVARLESTQGDVNLPALFERSFRRALLYACIDTETALREFFGREHNQSIERFRQIDDQLASLTSKLVHARLAKRIPRDNVRDEIPTAEMGLLRKELGKKMRHIPVRQLLNRIPTLLPRLKPCVLMSPLSVAQYLDASHELFDVVLFDEASQIPVWDAIGAIARGKQLIVVGDPKQLPPTNFFNTNDEDEDDLTPDEHKDLESILDELLSNGMRHKRLQWHYRSRHEGLITFSNRLYYENDLLTFPSPETAHGGVRFMHVPDARYDKGKSRTNRREAEVLVLELVTRLKKTDGPARSYGVVTFSQAQQALVENLLDEERRKHPEIEHHFGDEPPVEGEHVFVKNLENVQGDERDVILFSICYGPDESGRVSMNFGPLNRDGGERRLNVAVTRAKHEVLVISGLRADQIELTRTRAKGVRDLKYFLDYAERGPRALVAATTASSSAEADSEFERMVADRIRAAGFEVHHQVGCSGYRIDLAVVDPAAPGRYLLGVECDGATYHRAATARDRDKLRQSVLEGLGWELHRVWSTDWWHDADEETKKLTSRLGVLRDQSAARAAGSSEDSQSKRMTAASEKPTAS